MLTGISLLLATVELYGQIYRPELIKALPIKKARACNPRYRVSKSILVVLRSRLPRHFVPRNNIREHQ